MIFKKNPRRRAFVRLSPTPQLFPAYASFDVAAP
jgi:hypothetical protein